MNSNILSKPVKRKVLLNSNMGQRVGTPSNSQSSCSIFSVDEDVQFVVDNSDNSEYSAAVPLDKNIELSRRTYSKKNPMTYPGILPTPEPFEFSVLSEVKPLTPQYLKRIVKPKKRKQGGTFAPITAKLQKKDVKCKPSTDSFSKNLKQLRNKSKAGITENEISSDSDIEVIEIKVVNTDALNLKSMNSYITKKPLHSQSFLNNKKKLKDFSDLPKKKNDTKPMLQHASKPCFTTENELVVNEADTAPYMPNNPNMFPDVRSLSGPIKWLGTNSTLESPRCSDRSVTKRREASPRNIETKPLRLLELKQSRVDRAIASRELKNLYANLNEISWTQENSFKKLLRNPEYLRHSERSAARAGETGKIVKKIKKRPLKNVSKATIKKSPTMKASLKKSKLAKVNTNKKLAKLNSNKITKLSVNKLAKSKTSKLINKPSANNLSSVDDKSKILKIKPNELNLKTNTIKPKVSPPASEKSTKLKIVKKQNSVAKEKSKPKTTVESSNMNSDIKIKPVISKEKTQIVPKPKVEVSEASSSGIQNTFGDDNSFYNAIQYSKDGNLKKFIQRESLDSKRFEMIKEYKKDDRMYTAVRKGTQCRVQIEPLEHTNLWNTEYYEDFRKQFLHQTLRKAMEKREPNCITTMLQELCDSYMMPAADDSKVAKKKKPEEETLRSSARQIEGAFRYKEIVVKKLQNYMQVILVPNGVKKNCLSIDAIKELRDAFLLAKKDPKCRAVLLNSSGSYFCTGIDLTQLIGPNKKQACEEMASVIRELVLVLGSFSKPVVAAVNGAALGFGVALLTYCDVVLASDKATFCVPSTTIGYMPEGGLTLTLPQIVGNVRSSEMLLQGTRLTASQAHQKGLVSEVLWPTRLMNEVIPRIQSIIAQPLQVMEATKLLVRANVWDKLKTHMDFERRLIVNQWLSAPCQDNIKRILRGDTLLE